jgi:hypothetical protein
MEGAMLFDSFGLTGIIAVVVGLVVLLAGRRLFWLFVGAAGFLAGFLLAGRLLADASPVVVLIVALLGGVIGAVLAALLQRVAIFVAGLIAGGALVLAVMQGVGVEAGAALIVGVVIGAVLGGVLALILFDPALIILSALTGATLVAESLPLAEWWQIIILAGLAVVGIVVQAATFRREKARAERVESAEG